MLTYLRMRGNTVEAIVAKLEIAKPILIRYILYSLALVESFALPKLIDEYNYSQYEYYKNFIFIFPYFLLGAHNGYVYLKYSLKVDYYQQLFTIGIIFLLIISCIFSVLFSNLAILLPLLITGLYTISEQYLKIQRRFTIIFLFKPLLSIITVLIAWIYIKQDSISYNYLLFISFNLTFVIWYILCPIKKGAFPFEKYLQICRFTFLRYGYLIKVYFTGVLAHLLFTLLIFFERYYIEKYYPNELASYSFAFNLSQIVVMILGAISYITSVELGEKMDNLNKTKLKMQFNKATFAYAIFFILFLLFVYFIIPFYNNFENLFAITAIITYAKGFFFLVGTISHLVGYFGFNTLMLKGLSLLFIIEAIIVYALISLEAPLLTLLMIDSCVLLIYSFFLLNIVFNKVKYKTESN